ncbi:MAG TPA: hypothetical protein VJH22_06640 [Candidatus Nanoarchaeia archaeon]|nr:hypothetical protein [Candidatus Nanoarchaeia archaeon]
MVERFESRTSLNNRWVFIKMANLHSLPKEDLEKIIAEMKKHGTTH